MYLSKKAAIISSIVAIIVLVAALFGMGYLGYTTGRESVYQEQSKTSVITLVNRTGDHLDVHIMDLCGIIFNGLTNQTA